MTAPTIPAIDPDAASPLDTWSAQMWAELLEEKPPQGQAAEFEVEVFTPKLAPLGMVGDYESARAKWVRRGVGVAQLVVAGDSEFAELFMSCDTTVIPVRVTYNGKNWDGRVDKAISRGVKGNKTITVTLVDNWVWFYAMMAYPMPIPGIEEAQIIPQDLWHGPLASGIRYYIERNVWRLKFRTGQCPITVLPYNALRDTSEFSMMQARMVPLGQLFEEWLRDSTLHVRPRYWIKGRDPQPMPDVLTLTESQIIVDVVDRPKKGGLIKTGTLLDSIVNTIAEAIADGIDDLVGGYLPDLADKIGKIMRQQELPSVVWSEDSDGIIDATVEVTAPKAYRAVVGGKSPSWLNKLVQIGVEAGISALLSFAQLIIPGLASALKGVLDNLFFAFMAATDYRLKAQLGPFALPEALGNGGPAAYTWSGRQVAKQTLFDNAGKRRAKIEVLDWSPWGAFRDYDIAHLVGWEDRVGGGELRTFYDRVEAIEAVDDRETSVLATAYIGDDEPDKSPTQKNAERVKRLVAQFNAITMAIQ
ncbi:hypothetical protein [Prescottella equi]|uniref:Gp37-like protein n=1 Tax=Rhodococcus hoagii TaxID=43767 RepID=UPI00111C6907|nr:hypothetical protein [Prescottella equi]